MHGYDWNHLRHFLEVVRTGSVSAAGKKLGVSYTTVSRRITSLEHAIDTPLFDRSANDWALTAAGEKILSSVESMSDFANEVQRNALSENQEISGLLRITSFGLIIEKLLLPELKAFQNRHPDIRIELISSYSALSLTTREADIAFRATNAPPLNSIGKRIGKMVFAIYGSRQILEDHLAGKPIPTITRIGDGRTLPDWIKNGYSDTPSTLRNDSIEVAITATRLGFGAAALPCFYADSDPDLCRLPNSPVNRGTDLWMLTHSDLRRTARMRLFRDFISKRLGQKIDLLEGRALGGEHLGKV